MNQPNDNTLSKIKRVLEFVWENKYSSFYREKYKKAGIKDAGEIKTWEDFKKLPFLTREEIVGTGPYERFFLPQNKVYGIAVTSGTTGGNLPLVFLQAGFPPLQEEFRHRKIRGLEIKALMLLLATPQGEGRLLTLPREGITLTGDISNLALSAKIAATVKIDGLHTTPTILSFFMPFLQKYYAPANLRYISLGGEFCSEQKLLLFRKVFKNAHFQFRYTGQESGIRGYRCDYMATLSPRFYHPLLVFYYEILNPRSESELALTHLTSRQVGFPLIRYRTGDMVKLTSYKCRCGLRDKMEVFGKLNYDVATVGGTFIHSPIVDQALKPTFHYLETPEWQIHIFEEAAEGQVLTKLKLQVVPKKTLSKNEQVQAQKLIIQKLGQIKVSSHLTFSELVEKGVFLPPLVEFVSGFPPSQKQKHFVSHIR